MLFVLTLGFLLGVKVTVGAEIIGESPPMKLGFYERFKDKPIFPMP
jgi:hypothetical protein